MAFGDVLLDDSQGLDGTTEASLNAGSYGPNATVLVVLMHRTVGTPTASFGGTPLELVYQRDTQPADGASRHTIAVMALRLASATSGLLLSKWTGSTTGPTIHLRFVLEGELDLTLFDDPGDVDVDSGETATVTTLTPGPITPDAADTLALVVTACKHGTNEPGTLVYTDSFVAMRAQLGFGASTVRLTGGIAKKVVGVVSTECTVSWTTATFATSVLLFLEQVVVAEDPANFAVSQAGADVVATWDAPVMVGATHVDVFRRVDTVATPFDPEVDAGIARVPVATLTYTDVGVAPDNYAYQAIPVIQT